MTGKKEPILGVVCLQWRPSSLVEMSKSSDGSTHPSVFEILKCQSEHPSWTQRDSSKVWKSVWLCFTIPTGCGCRGRGKLHHPLLRADGLRGMSHLNRDTRDLLPGGPINGQGSCQEAQTGCFWTCLVHNFGLSHQGLLSGWHAGCTEGEVLNVEWMNQTPKNVWFNLVLIYWINLHTCISCTFGLRIYRVYL